MQPLVRAALPWGARAGWVAQREDEQSGAPKWVVKHRTNAATIGLSVMCVTIFLLQIRQQVQWRPGRSTERLSRSRPEIPDESDISNRSANVHTAD